MTTKMYLRIDDVKGEATEPFHVGQIDILAWSFGESATAATHLGGGGHSAGRVHVQDLSLTKFVDKSSPALMLACCNSGHFGSARLMICKGGGKPFEFVVMEMSDVVVTSISVGGASGEDRLTENLTLSFATFKYSYTPQKADGSADASASMGWDVARNQPI